MLLFPSGISEHVLNENTYTERNIPMEKLFTRKEAATMLGISLATLDTARKDGSIAYIQYVPNGCVFFTDEGLQEFIAKNTHRAVPMRAVTTYRNPRKRRG